MMQCSNHLRRLFARSIGRTITAKTNTASPNTTADVHHTQPIAFLPQILARVVARFHSACVSVGRSIAPVRCHSPSRSLGTRGQERPSTISSSCGGVEGHALERKPSGVTSGVNSEGCACANPPSIDRPHRQAGIKPGPHDSISQFTGGPNLGEAAPIPQCHQPRLNGAAPILRRAA